MYYSNYYLAHHGIVGMHWGVRRYQNNDGTLTKAGKARYGTSGEAKIIKNKLTDLDKASGDAQYDYKSNEIKRQKFADKATKAAKKGNSIKQTKYEDLAKRHEAERDAAERRVKSIDKNINSIINKAMKDGYDIKMTAIARQPESQKGKDFAKSLVFGAVPYMTVKSAIYKKHGQASPYSEGFIYKVTPGAGIVNETRKNIHW